MMNDPPQILRPMRLASGGHSPTRQRGTDDILIHISPATVVDALASTSGPLKTCLEGASAAEREFALETAVASKKIWEWVHELRDWHWPKEGGAAGFEPPVGKRRGITNTQENETEPYAGWVPVATVLRYEERIEQIQNELESLSVEDLKMHVMTNHIMPLSRPTTPSSIRSGFSTISSYIKMEDLTAVVTAVVVQMLPNLAKLYRLLHLWTIRVAVLQQIPGFLQDLEDAEVALNSGWKAISLSPKSDSARDIGTKGSTLAQSDFQVMKLVVEKKMRKPGRVLDFMLDRLEGLPDTLPDGWLDRMEVVERGYGDWVAACERKMRESEWAKPQKPPKLEPLPEKEEAIAEPSHADDVENPAVDPIDSSAVVSSPCQVEVPDENPTESRNTIDSSAPEERDIGVEDPEVDWADSSVIVSGSSRVDVLDESSMENQDTTKSLSEASGLDVEDSIVDFADSSVVVSSSSRADVVEEPSVESHDTTRPLPSKARDAEIDNSITDNKLENSVNSMADQLPEVRVSTEMPDMGLDGSRDSLSPDLSHQLSDWDDEKDNELEAKHPYDLLSPSPERPEPELPPLRGEARRNSISSQASTVLYEASIQFDGMSSDLPEVSASPDISRSRVHEAKYAEDSPPSSPPVPEADARESSFVLPDHDQSGYLDMDDSGRPKTPVDESFNESFMDDSFSMPAEPASPSLRLESTGDQQLHAQINEIIQRIPAKIKLTEKPPINLNPPDLQLPKLRKKPSKEPFRRTMSSVSSRNATPSFTLSPAKSSRPRPQRGQQDIKVYHLSRSTGEAPIKLFIRCVGENGERVMVRVGGGWADLSEYLKEYASHHGRRSTGKDNAKVEIQDVPRAPSRAHDARSSPPVRSVSALDMPMSPLHVRKTRRSMGSTTSEAPRLRQSTPGLTRRADEMAISEESFDRSRSNSRMSWVDDDSSFLGLAGPNGKKVEMSEENKAWVESVKEKVRIASGERRVSAQDEYSKNKFGELGRVGGTKRLFRKGEGSGLARDGNKK